MERKLILIVDDDDQTREVIVSALQLFGYRVIEAENGADALKQVKDHKPDVVISDIFMPCMNGLEFVEQLVRINGRIPVILITGYNPEIAQQYIGTCNVINLLVKPFRLNELQNCINLALQT